MTTQTFINYKQYRWLWITLIALILACVGYCFFAPPGGNNGGTIIGYTYGVIATLGIAYLMWFGIRKRSYRHSNIPLKSHLSAHVWIGIGLLFLVPLHSGFQFGWNVHTTAYALMVATILSGIWGAVNYASLPTQVRSHRGGGTLEELVEQIENISNEIQALVDNKSDAFITLLNTIDFTFKPSLITSITRSRFAAIDRTHAAEKIVNLPGEEREDGMKLISTINKKIELAERVRNEARTLFWLKIWLYVHLPISFALVAAVVVHIISVFWYW